MAFFQDDDDNNSQGMNNPQNPQQEQGTQLSTGIANTSSSGSIPTGSQSQTSPKSTSSGMTGFQNYQKANTGTATNKLAGAASQNVAAQGQRAKTGINQATTAFGQKVDQGSLANRQNALQDVKNVVDSARNITAAPQQQQANNAPQQPAVDPMSYLAPEQSSRFQQVINAKYQGPESLRQSGDYQKASANVQSAQTAVDQAGSAQGREALLRSIFSQGGNYNQGLNKLDASLLNASGQGVKDLQQTAQAQGNISKQLDQAQINSANLVQNRTQEIRDIRQQSRDAFTQGKTAEEVATDTRLGKVIKDWDKLPEYFKQIIRDGQGGASLNTLESGILGVGSGEGLYNLGADAIATGVADKNKLISRDEQARQAALASLGKLDADKLLNTDLKYADANLAGTQSALDALDLTKTRANINSAEEAFRDTAEGTNLTGYGKKKVSRGNATGKKTKTYRATVGGNVGDFLEQAGYKLDSEIGKGQNTANQQELLKAALAASSTNKNNADAEDNQKVLQSTGQGAALGASLGAIGGGPTAAVGAGIGGTLGAMAGSGTVDTMQMYSDFLRGMGGPAGSIGKGIQDGRGIAGDIVSETSPYNPTMIGADAVSKALGMGSVSSGIAGAVSGIDSGAMKKFGSAKARQNAVKDLNKKYTGFLDTQGFDNRVNVEDSQENMVRAELLQKLLADMDKTNS